MSVNCLGVDIVGIERKLLGLLTISEISWEVTKAKTRMAKDIK